MDNTVAAAMEKWPDVPAVAGWLSLNSLGQWRFHPDGNAHLCDSAGLPQAGQAIANTQIVQFMHRNYDHDDQGRWYVQNGPQRVYVRLDAAPYVLHACSDTTGIALQTHNGLALSNILAWYMDEHGRLFAQTNLGPALVCGRDTPVVVQHMADSSGASLESLPQTDQPAINIQLHLLVQGTPRLCTAPFTYCLSRHLPDTLGFVALPAP
jgi:hypothetical protein